MILDQNSVTFTQNYLKFQNLYCYSPLGCTAGVGRGVGHSYTLASVCPTLQSVHTVAIRAVLWSALVIRTLPPRQPDLGKRVGVGRGGARRGEAGRGGAGRGGADPGRCDCRKIDKCRWWQQPRPVLVCSLDWGGTTAGSKEMSRIILPAQRGSCTVCQKTGQASRHFSTCSMSTSQS